MIQTRQRQEEQCFWDVVPQQELATAGDTAVNAMTVCRLQALDATAAMHAAASNGQLQVWTSLQTQLKRTI
jgi:uncharacterized protein (DUF2252 family)